MSFPNPFDPAYLVQASAAFGPYAWVFALLQLAIVAAGVYLAFFRNDQKQAGMLVLGAGGVGIILSALRLGNVAVFNQRYWFWLLLLVELGLAGYLFATVRTAASQPAARTSSGRGKTAASSQKPRTPEARANGSVQPAPGGQSASGRSGRRDARRERKRKSR